jgi:hypothetical protein
MAKNTGRDFGHLSKNPRFFTVGFGVSMAVLLSQLLDSPISPVYYHARLVAVWGQRPVLVFFGPRAKCIGLATRLCGGRERAAAAIIAIMTMAG